MSVHEIFNEESWREWAAATAKRDVEFARKIRKDHPNLRLKEMLDGRREEIRWAVSVNSGAKILGLDVKTLRKIIREPFQSHFSPIKASPNGHSYIWLEDILNFSKVMIERSEDS